MNSPIDKRDDRRQTAGREEGEALKRKAHDLLSVHRARHVLRGRRALLVRLLETGRATADDVRAAVRLPPGLNPKLFGSVSGDLARLGIIRADGFEKTNRKIGHARPLTVWVLVDRAAAEAWLAAHPDTPDDVDEPRPDDRTE